MNETLKTIAKLIEKYREISESDSPDINELIKLQSQITCWGYTLSTLTSDYRDIKNGKYFDYDSAVIKKEHKYVADGLKTLTAKNAAKFDCLDLHKSFLQAESCYKRLKSSLDQLNKTVMSLMQKIAQLREDKKTSKFN